MQLIRPFLIICFSCAILGQFGCSGAAGSAQTARSTATQTIGVSPNAVNAGQGSFVLAVTGVNFQQSSSVLWNGSPTSTTFVSASELTAQIASADVATPSTAQVAVVNTATGAQSNSVPLAVVKEMQITNSQLPAGVLGQPYSAPLAVSGGAPPFRWSVSEGGLPAGITMNSSSGEISGDASAAGNFAFTAWVTDALNSSAKANLAIDVSSGSGSASSSSTAAGFYGSGLGANSLGNTPVGGPFSNTASYRFLAKHSGVLEQARIYLIPDHPGYAGGTAGTIQVTLTTDDGTSAHNPTSTVLASYVISNVLSLASPARYFYLMKFASPPTLTAGQLYHFVFKNIDPSPLVNFLSVDDLYETPATTPTQPTISDTNAAVLLSQGGGPWTERPGYTPIYELDFANGISEGIGYIEVWSGTPETISGTNAVRETFTVSGSQISVSSVAVRVALVNSNGPLVLRLENSDGSLIEETSVPATQITESTSSSPVYAWMSANFSSAHVLSPGQTYHLDLEADAPTEYLAFPIRKGLAYGFQNTTYFPDGYAEFMQNGSWVGWTQWGVTNRTDGDLQFYFNLTQ